MTVAREQIFAELDLRLSAVTGVQSYERMPSGDPDIFPAIVLYEDSDQPEESEVGNDRRALGITVEGYVEGGSGAGAHAAMNALHAEVIKALMTEPPLGGLAETIAAGGMRVDVAELASVRRLGFAQDFEIQFALVRGDPTDFA